MREMNAFATQAAQATGQVDGWLVVSGRAEKNSGLCSSAEGARVFHEKEDADRNASEMRQTYDSSPQATSLSALSTILRFSTFDLFP